MRDFAQRHTHSHVATSTVERLFDDVINTPSDPLTSAQCVKQRSELIAKNLALK